MYLAGSDIDTLWSAATQIANELGADRYQVMYALYEANKEFFINEDINNPRADKDYFSDTSMIESVDVTFASREVKDIFTAAVKLICNKSFSGSLESNETILIGITDGRNNWVYFSWSISPHLRAWY